MPGRNRGVQRPHARAEPVRLVYAVSPPERAFEVVQLACPLAGAARTRPMVVWLSHGYGRELAQPWPVSCVSLPSAAEVVRCIASDYTQDVREIRWTDKSEDHIAAHNVTPDEVEQVLYARPRLVLRGAEGAEYAFGTTEAGRYLLVALAESIDGRAYVVTARDMTDAERQAFRRKGR